MFRFVDTALDDIHEQRLIAWQAQVDAAGGYAAQVEAAKRLFGQRNRAGNATFDHVKSKLREMCCGIHRCSYCEDSFADEVEHMRPKDLYPEEAFAWSNYIYACGPCNGPKNNRFAVIAGVPPMLVEVTRAQGAPITRPVPGVPALLDPRVDDPMNYLFLDLGNTFAFRSQLGLSEPERLRAEFTIEVLRLNKRDHLIASRKNAFRNYRARVRDYVRARDAWEDISKYQAELRQMDHRTVWLEMKRWRQSFGVLRDMFDEAPECLAW